MDNVLMINWARSHMSWKGLARTFIDISKGSQNSSADFDRCVTLGMRLAHPQFIRCYREKKRQPRWADKKPKEKLIVRNDRIIPITVTLLGSLLLASCGNTLSRGSLNSYSETGGSVSYGSPANVSGATTTSDGYTCPSQPNVNTTGDPSFTGTDDYTVCTSSSSTTKILVHGKTANSQTICIFPAQRVDEQHLYAKPDVTTGLPLVQCSTISSGGVYADFSGVNYNAAFIVEGPDKDQMQQCLAMGQPYSCPAYSYGQFRN